MWAYSYEIDKRTKERARKIIWIEDKLPSIETEIKDSPIPEQDNNSPLIENKEEQKEAKRKKKKGKGLF